MDDKPALLHNHYSQMGFQLSSDNTLLTYTNAENQTLQSPPCLLWLCSCDTHDHRKPIQPKQNLEN